MTYIPHIITPKAITVIIDGTPNSITSDHANFQQVDDMLTAGDFDTLRIIELMKPIVEFNQAITNSSFYRDPDGFIYLTVAGYPFRLPDQLEAEVLRVNKAAGNLQPLVNFVTKLAANPYKDVHGQLFGFLQVCGLALTVDGDFLAYKNVNEDFTDIYTGKIDNSPGQTPEMPRHAVEKNPDITCSTGLHFAAWGYLKNYHYGKKTVVLKINPADVVSIPTDYNNMKGRACKYYVLKEVEQPEELKNITVFNSSEFPQEYIIDEDDYDEDDYDYEDDYDDYYDFRDDEYEDDFNEKDLLLREAFDLVVDYFTNSNNK